mgnify:CR=1 FL=1
MSFSQKGEWESLCFIWPKAPTTRVIPQGISIRGEDQFGAYIPTHPVDPPCGRKQEYPEKNHEFQ